MTAAPRALRPSGALRLRRADATVVPALQAGVAMGLPLVILFATGHLPLLAFAAFGGFTSLYGRNEPYAVRGRLLAAVGFGLVACVAAGTAAALAASFWVSTAVVALVAGAAKLLSDGLRTGPPAGLMPTFACAVCAELPLHPGDVGPAVVVAAVAAAWSWVVCMSGRTARPHGPERVAVARALNATAVRVEAVGSPAEPHARHAAAVAIRKAWQAVGSSGRPTGQRSRLEALCSHAETAMRFSRLVGEPGGSLDTEVAADLRALAAQLRRPTGAVPVVALTPAEQAELDGLRAEDLLTTPAPSRDVWRAAAHPASAGGHLLRAPVVRWGSTGGRLRPSAPFLPLAVRATVAAAVAGTIAHLLGLGHTSWASVSAVAVLQAANLTTTLTRGVQRAAGTVAGLLLGVASLLLVPDAGVAVALVIAFQVAAELVVGINYALALVFATPLALLLAHVGHLTTPASTLVWDRLLDTLIGAAVAIVAALLIPNRRVAEVVRRAMAACEQALAAARQVPDDEARAKRHDTARLVAARLFVLRDAYDTAAGEPWPGDLPAEPVLRLERDGHAELARLTR